MTSASNTFNNVLPGVSLQIANATGNPVTVTVASDDSQVAANLQTFVTNYNKFRSQLTTDTAYDTTTNTGSVLSDDSSALQLDTQLSALVSGSISGAGPVQSLAQLGITVQSDGTLSFDQSALDSEWSNNASAVQQFFTATNNGFAVQFNQLCNQLAGNSTSLLSERINALQSMVADNTNQINTMNDRLNTEENLLYTSFYNMDIAIGKIQNSQSVLNQMSPLTPYTGVTTTSS